VRQLIDRMSLTEHPGYLLWERTLQKTDCRVTFTVDAAAEPQPLALGCVFACTGDDLRVSGGKMDMYTLATTGSPHSNQITTGPDIFP
jgi:hypothetical protein